MPPEIKIEAEDVAPLLQRMAVELAMTQAACAALRRQLSEALAQLEKSKATRKRRVPPEPRQ